MLSVHTESVQQAFSSPLPRPPTNGRQPEQGLSYADEDMSSDPRSTEVSAHMD